MVTPGHPPIEVWRRHRCRSGEMNAGDDVTKSRSELVARLPQQHRDLSSQATHIL